MKLNPAQKHVVDWIIEQVRRGQWVIPIQVPIGFGRLDIAAAVVARMRRCKNTKTKVVAYLTTPFSKKYYESKLPTGVLLRTRPEILVVPNIIVICFDRRLLKYPPAGTLITLLST